MLLDSLKGKINRPYPWSTADLKIVREFPYTSHNDWTALSYRYAPIKERIKDHYSIQQNDHCVYCRSAISYKGWDEPIEHIIHKEHRYTFMFTPFNLALSCRHCNTKKSTKHSLHKPFRNANAVSRNSDEYRIIHPHIDNFEDYVYLEDNLFFRSINRNKGLLHIMFFKLNEETLLLRRAKAINISRANYYQKLMHKVYDKSISNREKRHYRKVANEIINRRVLS